MMISNLLNRDKTLTKETQQLQTATEGTTTTWTKIKNYIIIVFASLIALTFFSYKFFPDHSVNYYTAESNFLKEKKQNTKALSVVKKLTVGTLEHQTYLIGLARKKASFEKLTQIKKSETFSGFESFHFFMERFGHVLAIFLYSLYNLFRSFYFEPRNIGNKILHSTVIFISFFYFYWIFQIAQELPTASYYVMIFGSTFGTVLAVWLVTKYQDHYINRLKKTVRELGLAAVLYTKDEHKEKVFKKLEEVTHK